MSGLLGGWSETRLVIQFICDEVKPQVEERTDKKYETFRALKYREQVVAGMNYLLKVHIGGANYIHLFVHKELPARGEKVVLLKVQENKSEHDPLEPF